MPDCKASSKVIIAMMENTPIAIPAKVSIERSLLLLIVFTDNIIVSAKTTFPMLNVKC
jgi:hypothetical protein